MLLGEEKEDVKIIREREYLEEAQAPADSRFAKDF